MNNDHDHEQRVHVHLHLDAITINLNGSQSRPPWVDEIIKAIAVLADSDADKAKMRELGKDIRSHAEALKGAIPTADTAAPNP